jgi:hypothetical protein
MVRYAAAAYVPSVFGLSAIPRAPDGSLRSSSIMLVLILFYVHDGL